MCIIRFSVDATHHEKLGKYINDSNEPNAKMKRLTVNGLAKLCLFALKNIPVGRRFVIIIWHQISGGDIKM